MSTMCRALGIARSSFCGWAARSPEEKDPWAAVREIQLTPVGPRPGGI